MWISRLGANVNRTTANNDHTVVSLACAGGHLAVVELLLAHGADPTHRLKVMHVSVKHFDILWIYSCTSIGIFKQPNIKENWVVISSRMVQPC